MFSWTEADPFRIKAERTSVTGWTHGGGGGVGGWASKVEGTGSEGEPPMDCFRCLTRWYRLVRSGRGLWTVSREVGVLGRGLRTVSNERGSCVGAGLPLIG